MIIVLEGLNGVGKSTCAQQLSEGLGIPLYRPFRMGNSDLHWGHEGEAERVLRDDYRIPLNTHIEDIFTADLLGVLNADVILDRSLPSAVAYGILNDHLDGYYRNLETSRRLLAYWQELLTQSGARVLYVWMTVAYDVAKHRCKGRWFPSNADWRTLDKLFTLIFERDIRVTKRVSKCKLVTTTSDIGDHARAVLSRMEMLERS